MAPLHKKAALAAALATTVASSIAATSSHAEASKPGRQFNIQLLSFNDFHGNLEPPSGSSGRITIGHQLNPAGTAAVDQTRDAGGVEYLATHLAQARLGHPNTLTVAAGDLIGASPLLSGAFHDEPSIEALNALHLDVSSVGNHEFDEGYKELQRIDKGGCIDDGDGANNQNSCAAGTYKGADFDYLAANVVHEGTNRTILPAYTIKKVGDAKIGFIGMTLKDTPNIVTAAGVAGLEFRDEVATANSLVPVLRKKGVNAIVVLIHQGGVPGQETWFGPDNKPYTVNPSYDYTCAKGGQLDPTSPIIPIAKGLSSSIDLIVSGHTHQPYVCDIKDPAGQSRMVTSASSFGRLYTDTEIAYDPKRDDIVRTSVGSANMVVTRDVPKNATETGIIAKYKTLVAPIASRIVGKIATDVNRVPNAGGETALGDLIADAQLADPSVVGSNPPPVIAFMNPGGIRTDLTYAASVWGEAPGDVTFEEAFNVQPFNNYLVSMTLTGAQIKALLNQQWTGVNAAAPKILQVSNGFAYTYSGTTLGQVTLGGQPLVDTQAYRVVTNNFLQGGGDGFPAFTQGTGVYYGGLDIDAFAAYLTAKSPYTPGALTRITKN